SGPTPKPSDQLISVLISLVVATVKQAAIVFDNATDHPRRRRVVVRRLRRHPHALLCGRAPVVALVALGLFLRSRRRRRARRPRRRVGLVRLPRLLRLLRHPRRLRTDLLRCLFLLGRRVTDGLNGRGWGDGRGRDLRRLYGRRWRWRWRGRSRRRRRL